MKTKSRLLAGLVAAGAIIVGAALTAAPASAIPGAPGPGPRIGPNTEITMTGTAEGQAVMGGLPVDGSTSDPGVAYPAAPPDDFTPYDAGFAGIITAEGTDGSSLRLYCIDIHTSTYPGIGYENGSWEDSGMPNLGYVARLLNDYYPNTDEPAAAPNDNARAAAVQAAIWYFTDNFVLDAGDPIRPLTEAIVNAIRVQPPLPTPTPPSLSITPAEGSATIGTPAGPFTVSTNAPAGATVSATGGSLFSDAAATVPVPNGTTVTDGQQLWAVPDDPDAEATATIEARGEATMPTGNVYIYDGNTPGVTDAQRLILAETVDVVTAVTATATFAAPVLASLTVSKAFAGPAAGSQGAVTLHVSCTNGLEQDISIPARTTDTTTTTIDGLPVGTVCAVTEPVDGASGLILVAPAGLGQIQITEGENTVAVTNTVTRELAPTGGSFPWAGAAFGALFLLGGTALIAWRRRVTA